MTWQPGGIKYDKIKRSSQLRRALCDSGLSSGYRGMVLIIEQERGLGAAVEMMRKLIEDQTKTRQEVLAL